MSNRFFNLTTPLVAGTVAKSSDVNTLFGQVATGLTAVEAELNRTLKLPAAESGSEHVIVEDAAARAGKILAFDSSGNYVIVSQLQGDLDANGHRITGFSSPLALTEPVTLGYLNAFAGSLAGLPSLAGQAGKWLWTDGASVQWQAIPSLPVQAGNNGKFLTSDGVSASWGAVPNTVPANTQPGLTLEHSGAVFSWKAAGDNVVRNPSGGLANEHWSTTLIPTEDGAAGGWYWVTGTHAAPTTHNHKTEFIPCGANQPIVVSCEAMTAPVSSGSCELKVEYYDAGQVLLSTSADTVFPNGATAVRKAAALVTPASTAYVKVFFRFNGVITVGAAAVRRFKLELGTAATGFNDNGTIVYYTKQRALTEYGKGFANPVFVLGDGTSTAAEYRARGAAGVQSYDARIFCNGGTSGTNAKGVWSFEASIHNFIGAIAHLSEFDNGMSGAAKAITLTVSNKQKLTLDTNACAITLTAPLFPSEFRLKLQQDVTGGRTSPTWGGAAITWEGGEVPVVNAGASEVTWVFFYYDGATLWGSWKTVN
jgi:hypothetical protein